MTVHILKSGLDSSSADRSRQFETSSSSLVERESGKQAPKKGELMADGTDLIENGPSNNKDIKPLPDP